MSVWLVLLAVLAVLAGALWLCALAVSAKTVALIEVENGKSPDNFIDDKPDPSHEERVGGSAHTSERKVSGAFQ